MAKKKKQRAEMPETRPEPHQFRHGNRWRFRPGVSGNPEGRAPENRESWRDFLNELDNPNTEKTRLRRLMELAYRRGCQGSFKHLELCLDRGFGRPTVRSESVNLNANLADVISEARRRVAAGDQRRPQLPTPIEVQAAEPKAPARSAPQRVIATEPANGEPANVLDALSRPTRESRQINVEPSFGRLRPN